MSRADTPEKRTCSLTTTSHAAVLATAAAAARGERRGLTHCDLRAVQREGNRRLAQAGRAAAGRRKASVLTDMLCRSSLEAAAVSRGSAPLKQRWLVTDGMPRTLRQGRTRWQVISSLASTSGNSCHTTARHTPCVRTAWRAAPVCATRRPQTSGDICARPFAQSRAGPQNSEEVFESDG